MIRMRKQKDRHLYWGPISSVDYLWGSVIERLAEDQIRFTNPLMPSGQVLKSWKSLTSYGEGRMAPSLPLLQRGQTYVVEVQMTSRPAHTVMLEVVCQDRFGKSVQKGKLSLCIQSKPILTKCISSVQGCKSLPFTISRFHRFRLNNELF